MSEAPHASDVDRVWTGANPKQDRRCILFFLTLGTGPRRSLSLKLSDARVYEPVPQRRRIGQEATGEGEKTADALSQTRPLMAWQVHRSE
jgi:hypothetical protein